MKNICLTIWFTVFCVLTQANIYSKDTILMGSSFTFTAVSDDVVQAYDALDQGIAEVARIEALISSWKNDSETAAINRNAGIKAVSVSQELFQLIERSLKVSHLSNGYFDISFASCNYPWKFEQQQLADLDTVLIAESVKKVNYQNIVLDKENSTVFLVEKGMRIGFGGIGKGYAADKAKALMISLGIESGVVNAGGDLVSWGSKPDNTPWTVGIINPENKSKVVAQIDVSNQAVVTSGDYERYVLINDVRHGHIINPFTGFPAKGVKSVTIVTQTAEIADALATTVFVMGQEKGLELVNQLKGVECIIINNNNEFIYSKNINLHFVTYE